MDDGAHVRVHVASTPPRPDKDGAKRPRQDHQESDLASWLANLADDPVKTPTLSTCAATCADIDDVGAPFETVTCGACPDDVAADEDLYTMDLSEWECHLGDHPVHTHPPTVSAATGPSCCASACDTFCSPVPSWATAEVIDDDAMQDSFACYSSAHVGTSHQGKGGGNPHAASARRSDGMRLSDLNARFEADVVRGACGDYYKQTPFHRCTLCSAAGSAGLSCRQRIAKDNYGSNYKT
jgi:hypothetical protein